MKLEGRAPVATEKLTRAAQAELNVFRGLRGASGWHLKGGALVCEMSCFHLPGISNDRTGALGLVRPKGFESADKGEYSGEECGGACYDSSYWLGWAHVSSEVCFLAVFSKYFCLLVQALVQAKAMKGHERKHSKNLCRL